MTYNSFIDASGKNGAFQAAQMAFDEARKYQLADVVTYSNFIEAMVSTKQVHLAQKVFQDNLERFVPNNFCIDFHGYNASTARFTLEWILENKPGEYSIITGKGLHSKYNESPVLKAFSDFCVIHQIKSVQDVKNIGLFYVSLIEKKLDDVKKKSSTPLSLGSFPFWMRGDKRSINLPKENTELVQASISPQSELDVTSEIVQNKFF